MYLVIEPDSPVPIFQQIHDGIVEGILLGRLNHGDLLLPVRKVAVEYGVNPATVKKAYDQLQEEGLVRTEPRSGTVITQPTKPTNEQRGQLRASLRTTVARALAQGFSPEEIHKTIDDLAISVS
ncbi:GntR family transcriptional regulator [Corynebacterium resistens]|mgnify:CR=1 FL=1|uniref:GntR family transcriptional regulator n=1 Tax=Corynebacterium resistens TaxID=258224 RepID=UPI002351FA8B|nr:GntR family transcriptional regulator [Corynebacterium resistens]